MPTGIGPSFKIVECRICGRLFTRIKKKDRCLYCFDAKGQRTPESLTPEYLAAAEKRKAS